MTATTATMRETVTFARLADGLALRHLDDAIGARGRNLRLASPVVEPLRHDLRRAVRAEGDAVEHARDLHRSLLMRDDQDLAVLREATDESQEALEIHIVERGLHLVHQVERRRPRREDREEEGERR